MFLQVIKQAGQTETGPRWTLSQTPHYADRCLRRISLLALIRAGFILSKGGCRVGELWPVGSTFHQFMLFKTEIVWTLIIFTMDGVKQCCAKFRIKNKMASFPFMIWISIEVATSRFLSMKKVCKVTKQNDHWPQGTGEDWLSCVSSVLKLQVMVRGMTFPKHTQSGWPITRH